MALINCNECNAQVSDKAKNCPKCGAPVIVIEKIKCFECGVELDKGTKTCSNCGVDQDLNGVIKSEPENKNTANAVLNNEESKPKSKGLMWTIIGVVAIILILVFALTNKNSSRPSNNNVDNSETNSNSASQVQVNVEPTQQEVQAPREKTQQELKQELLNKERRSPLSYLSVNYKLDFKVRLLKASETIVSGYIINSATLATFKDVVIKVKFLTNTNAVIETRNYTLYEYVNPNTSTPFKVNVVAPAGTRQIGVDLVQASSAQ